MKHEIDAIMRALSALDETPIRYPASLPVTKAQELRQLVKEAKSACDRLQRNEGK